MRKLCCENFQRKKNVLTLSTMEPILGVTKDDQKLKHQMYKLSMILLKEGLTLLIKKWGHIPRCRKAENGVELLFLIY